MLILNEHCSLERRGYLARVIENPRKLILDEAQKILYNEGYSNISIRRLARECNIAVGTIYNYFPSKNDLIVEMMTNFWEGYFDNIDSILNEREDFYENLRNIFEQLSKFIKKFRAVWLNSDIYSSSVEIESGFKRHDIYIDKLIRIVEKMLINDYYDGDVNKLKFNSHDLASFIIMNLISMVQEDYCNYDFFEKIIKETL